MIFPTLFAALILGSTFIAYKATRERRELAMAQSKHLRAGRD